MLTVATIARYATIDPDALTLAHHSGRYFAAAWQLDIRMTDPVLQAKYLEIYGEEWTPVGAIGEYHDTADCLVSAAVHPGMGSDVASRRLSGERQQTSITMVAPIVSDEEYLAREIL